MRRWRSIVKATVLELVSEPLAFLLTVSAVAAVALASAFHIHQFGEPSRMARDSSLSALLVFGVAYAVFCTVKAFRRELESGTAQMALAHPVSRPAFFLAKAAGAFAAYLVFAATMFCAAVTTVAGAEAGGVFAAARGDIAFVWGPALAFDAATVVAPLVAAAALNRFARFRFTATATWLALLVSAAGAALTIFLALGEGVDPALASLPIRLAPAAVLLAIPAAVFTLAAAALSVRFKDNAAAAGAFALAAASLPAFGNYYLSDALAAGGAIPWGYVALAAAAALPAAAAFALAGVWLMARRDVA